MIFFEICEAFLISVGLAALLWIVCGKLLLPNQCSVTVVISPQGAAEGLEQTVRAVLWLRQAGLWRGGIRVDSRGLTAEGKAFVRKLAEQYGLEVSTYIT